MNPRLNLMTSHCLILLTILHLILKNYAKVSLLLHLSLERNCAMGNSFRLSVKEPVNCCVGERNRYLDEKIVSLRHFVELVCFYSSAHV
jgi:hypothetical protein